VEKHFGDLDAEFDRDRCASLLEALRRSGLRVEGDAEHVDASLRSAVVLYAKFRIRAPLGASPKSAPSPTVSDARPMPTRYVASAPRPAPEGEWPRWSQPDDDAVLRLAQVAAPLVRMLHPDIVHAVVEDNRRNAGQWSDGLRRRGVEPAAYLWDGSACAFPGVRRYAGSKEIAEFRGHGKAGASAPPGALRLDDNDFPKHLWSFVFRGKPFQKFGPDGYALAHLADHKDHGNRREEEFDCVDRSAGKCSWYGLYTSAANSAYTPLGLVKPTDFSPHLRHLLQLRAQSLYGGVCALVPPGFSVRPAVDQRWSADAFVWSEPVGTLRNVPRFLEFRAQLMSQMLEGQSTSRP
jgi:hypothetical protein